MDNDVPVILVKNGYDKFAYCPQIGIYHYYFSNLKELVKKRLKGVKTYTTHGDREYKWINTSKTSNIILLAYWIIYSNIIIPEFIASIYNFIKYRELAFLYRPIVSLLITDTMIYGFLKRSKLQDIRKL